MNNFFNAKFLLVLILGSCFVSCSDKISYEEKWFTFNPVKDYKNSIIMMEDWLDAPAGKHGFVMNDGEDFRFEDGTSIKFWGVNICSGKPYVENEVADEWIDYLAKFGVNAVRFHKFTSHALKGNVSTILDPEMMDRMDYFQARLKERGIYYGWSHIYGLKPKPDDKDKLIAYEEIAGIEVPWSHLNGATSGLVNFAPDLQDLSIKLTVNMLNHINPYTGLRYAEDPALNFIELQNEDNIFWGAIEEALKQTPTYRALLCEQFSGWLIDKYRTQEALLIAWGSENIPYGENLEQMNIYPQPNHHVFTAEYEKALAENRKINQHYLDKGRFLFEKQIEFYDRFVDAIRGVGYKGPIVGSCWQAGSGLLNLYNIYADYKTGLIDRHNYFGGGTGHRLQPGKVKNEAMVSNPGDGFLSMSFANVIDRPFAFSEWMSLQPNQWTAEAVPIVAIYGMGLLGWDASYAFASNDTFFSQTLQSGNHGVYNVESPLHLSYYPAIARMIYRGDIEESDPIVIRKTHVPSLADGLLGFNEFVEQNYDFKTIKGEVPSEALAIGKVVLEFSETPKENIMADISDYWDKNQKEIHSVTGQLSWDYNEKGYFSVNSAGTQGVVGFAEDKKIELTDCMIRMKNPFGIILLTSLEKDKSIATSDKILITTLAKAMNTDMMYNEDTTELLDVGTAPVLMEGVMADIKIKRKSEPIVTVLDHIGRKTDKTVPVNRQRFLIDGGLYQTMYYLIEF